MLGFTDTAGDFWSLNLTIGFAEDFESVDLGEVYDGPASLLDPDKEFIIALMTDRKLQWSLMWLLICDQAQERGITDKQLKYRVDGKVKEEITEAYNASLMDFFPKLRTFLSQLREMQKATEDKLNKGLEKKVAVEQKKIMKLIETELAKLG